MTMLQIALLQPAAHGADQQANLRTGADYCSRAAALGADIALFPEMWNIGYTGFDPAEPGARERWQAQAIGADGPFVSRYRRLARELDLAIAVTYLERRDGPPRNSVSLIDRHGDLALTYAKVHTFAFDAPENACTPGDRFQVCTLNTRVGAVRVGAMICFDREFPESARILMLEGAELILTPNACELEANRLGQFRARAFENMVGVAMANYPAPQQNGHSAAYSPIAFDEQGRGRDTTIVEAGEEEGIAMAAFDLDGIRAYREREVWGNACRHPGRYEPLTAPAVAYPFIRQGHEGSPPKP